MRWIEKKHEPAKLLQWRLKNSGDVNFAKSSYEMMRQDHDVREELESQLLAEQGALCAYTGRRIGSTSSHMEHVKPQDFCTPAEKVSYLNLVACYPEPNRPNECPYGAVAKKNFPKPGEEWLFVSPLNASCEFRFHYTYSGHIRPADADDAAAVRTIEELQLDHEELCDLRRAAIKAVLLPNNEPLSLDKARNILSALVKATTGNLVPFSFAVKQAVENNVQALEKAAAAGATRKQK